MFSVRRALLVAVAFASAVSAQDPKDEPPARKAEDVRDASALRKITDRVFIHDAANMSFTLPEGWTSVPPHSLTRKIDPRVTSVLSIKQPLRDTLTTISWSKLNKGQSINDWVRVAASAGEFGEEYETLKAIYGKERVAEPVKTRVGDFDIFKIDIKGGPDRGDKYDGMLALFAGDYLGETWLVKVRMSFPKGTATPNTQSIAAVLEGFKRNPDRTAPELKKKLIDSQ